MAGKKYPYHGRMMTIREVSKETGICEGTLRSRMSDHNMTLEAAAEYKRPKRYKKGGLNQSEKTRKVIQAYFNGAETVEEIEELTGASRTMIYDLIPIREYKYEEPHEKKPKTQRELAEMKRLCEEIWKEGEKFREQGVHRTGKKVPEAAPRKRA